MVPVTSRHTYISQYLVAIIFLQSEEVERAGAIVAVAINYMRGSEESRRGSTIIILYINNQ